MKRSLNFPPEIESRLQSIAGQRGTTVEDAALQILVVGLHSLPDDTMPHNIETVVALYAHSLATGGELTAFSNAPDDIYQYSADDLAAMERGEFEKPLS